MVSHLWVSFHSAESLIQSSGTRRDTRGSIALTVGEHAFQIEAEAIIALGFVLVTLCLLMFLWSFT